MERFSREIQKQSDYINSLKQRVSQSEQYADHLRDGRYAEELKVQEANKRIFELQRTNQQLERLVKLIPPEVLEERRGFTVHPLIPSATARPRRTTIS